MKIISEGAELFHADRQTDMSKLIFAFPNYANAPKIILYLVTQIIFGKFKAITLQAWAIPEGFQDVEAPRFQDNRDMKVVRLSAVRTGCLYPPGNIPDT